MTEPDDEMTAALARTLRHHAEEAPSAEGLPEKAVALAHKRRRRRINTSIAAIVVLAAGIPVAVVATVDGTPPAANEAHPTWRWESFRNVQVQVPPDWGYGAAGQDWCAGTKEGETRRLRPGGVGRPRDVDTIGCPSEYPPVNERENSLTFSHRNMVGERRLDGGWVEETRRVDGVFLTVFTNDDALRSDILDSAEPINGTDRNGCPTDHPVTEDPDGYRPDSTDGGLPPADEVESISVCRYELESDAVPLLSSSRVAGAGAKDAVAAILAAPEGVGPDVEDANPGSDATEIVLLRIDTGDGVREVVVRYSDETGNGFDDGKTKHVLTTDSIRPLLTGANRPSRMFLPVAMLFPA